MTWWVWLLIGWAAVGLVGALLLGAAARVIKRHERADRADTLGLPTQRSAAVLPLPREPSVSEERRRAPRR
jgi:hypothetical protein